MPSTGPAVAVGSGQGLRTERERTWPRRIWCRFSCNISSEITSEQRAERPFSRLSPLASVGQRHRPELLCSHLFLQNGGCHVRLLVKQPFNVFCKFSL